MESPSLVNGNKQDNANGIEANHMRKGLLIV